MCYIRKEEHAKNMAQCTSNKTVNYCIWIKRPLLMLCIHGRINSAQLSDKYAILS